MVTGYAAWLSNLQHGLRYTTKDKQSAAEKRLKAHPKHSDSRIGEELHISHTTVAAARKRLESTCQIDKSTERQGKDGRTTTVGDRKDGRPSRDGLEIQVGVEIDEGFGLGQFQFFGEHLHFLAGSLLVFRHFVPRTEVTQGVLPCGYQIHTRTD